MSPTSKVHPPYRTPKSPCSSSHSLNASKSLPTSHNPELIPDDKDSPPSHGT